MLLWLDIVDGLLIVRLCSVLGGTVVTRAVDVLIVSGHITIERCLVLVVLIGVLQSNTEVLDLNKTVSLI